MLINNIFKQFLLTTYRNQINNEKFLVQKSLDGIIFETICVVIGKGNYKGISNYSFTDMNSSNGINYYRLAQMDFDKSEQVSTVKAIAYGKSGE